MRKVITKNILPCLVLGLLTACVSTQSYMPPQRPNKTEFAPSQEQIDNADYGAYPVNHKAIIKIHYARILKDPTSVIYGAITKPIKDHAIASRKPIFGYSVCVSVNAKNSFGGYAGMETTWFLFRDSKIIAMRDPKYGIYIGRKVTCGK